MKKIITFICISIFCTFSINAQMNKEARQKIKVLKVAYLTDQLNLTSDEAEKFWPIYNVFDKKQNTLRNTYKMALRKTMKKENAEDGLNESDAKKLISLKLLTDKQLYESQKSFINKIGGVISSKKIVKLQIAEMEFGRKLMRKYKRKRSDSRD